MNTVPTNASRKCVSSGVNLDHMVSWIVIERAGEGANTGKTVYVLQLSMVNGKEISLVLGDDSFNDFILRTLQLNGLVPIG